MRKNGINIITKNSIFSLVVIIFSNVANAKYKHTPKTQNNIPKSIISYRSSILYTNVSDITTTARLTSFITNC